MQLCTGARDLDELRAARHQRENAAWEVRAERGEVLELVRRARAEQASRRGSIAFLIDSRWTSGTTPMINERRAAAMFGAFSMGAIAIVLGGTVWDVLALVTGQFGRLVAIANVAAWPIAWLAMHRWLAGFAYRIDLGFGVFAAAAAGTFAIAWLTVATIAARAAAAQPIRALRQE